MNANALEIQEPGRQEIAETPSAAPDAGNLTPMQMAYHLIQNGADLGSVKEMLAMSRELAAEQARRAFDAAVSSAKADIPIIGKNATGHNSKRYADFAAYAAALKPILAKYGLSYRFRTEQTDKISVTCVLSHKDGHSEENTLSGPADSTGSKNAIQAIGSTLTYLQRYTLIQALGLAATEDDDGQRSEQTEDDHPIDAKQIEMIEKAIKETNTDTEKFLEWLEVPSIAEIPASQMKRVMQSFDAIRRRAGR
ncbi:MAG: ERF family protein [Rhizobiaceae bacterium]